MAILAAALVSSSAVVAAPPQEPALRIAKSAEKANPALARAFQAFKSGDAATAEIEYAKALKSDPGNPDALHGAAAVALFKKERERADALYRRALAANPRDAVAVAGVAGLNGYMDSAGAESRLKSLISVQPDEPGLYFALGNIYASTGRWRDAQQAYFSAHVAAPEQPDYLFNLAVSLDHLRQAQPARAYYEKALSAASRLPAAFDPAQAAARLNLLAQ